MEETTFKELKEFLEETMVTKDDLKDLVTKDDIRVLRDELISEINGIKVELEDIKQSLDRLEKRTRQDADAEAKDILDLKRRVDELEKQIKLFHGIRQPA